LTTEQGIELGVFTFSQKSASEVMSVDDTKGLVGKDKLKLSYPEFSLASGVSRPISAPLRVLMLISFYEDPNVLAAEAATLAAAREAIGQPRSRGVGIQAT
jgi:hypothetical protein